MSTFAAICQLLYGIVLVVGAVPMGVLMACFCCDSGKPNRRLVAFGVFAGGILPAIIGVALCWSASKALF